jgi:hypothetical protein
MGSSVGTISVDTISAVSSGVGAALGLHAEMPKMSTVNQKTIFMEKGLFTFYLSKE